MNPQPHDAPVPNPPPSAHRPPSRRSRWLGTLLMLAVVALLGGGAWYLVQRSTAPAGAMRGAGGPGGPGGPGFGGGGRAMVTVGEATARQASLPVVIDALGTVTPVTTVTLRPQVSGVLTQVLFTEGQMVKKGQVLAQIDPRPYEQALMQAQGTRQRDEAQLDNARITLERYRTLLSQDSIARQDVDTQAALVKQLQGTVMTDLAQEKTARLNLDYTRVTSPATGRIGLRTVDAGNYVSAGEATGIATITQMTPIDVQFSVPQDRVTDVQASQQGAQPLAVTAFDRTRTTEVGKGQFSTLDNLVDTTTGTVKAKARFENANGALFPNQFVNVQLLLREVPAVVVPVTAVRTGANGDFVYVINEDRTVSLRKVKRGQATVGLMAVTEGLKAGERVVTEGGDRLKDGATVQLQGARGPASAASGAAGAQPRRARASGPRGEGEARGFGPRGEGRGPEGERRQRPPQEGAHPGASAPQTP
ncbi:efflux RND transporter periplasmic adaptor subunit [Acidovorax sp. SUPP1855]|uniref:efflux RND transporter periplasmic adaptor subunit n=1 Tax=Acidovorax sp. SUPP1855 TaxID=431774 RepID=UPI0023DE2EA8|nr:efflux RND transporter periplasmic adaptor subunit [Acidovorax sp. SUPP1855]GKS83754.1 efflux RND transporter periplasmic adaptor subunit [Acidovorax sp. SUPP1855]